MSVFLIGPSQCLVINLGNCALNRGNTTHEAFLRNARNSEETLRREAIERTELSVVKEAALLASLESVDGEVYQVPSTGAMVSLNSAVGLIHFYCSQLPTDRYSQPFFPYVNAFHILSVTTLTITLVWPLLMSFSQKADLNDGNVRMNAILTRLVFSWTSNSVLRVLTTCCVVLLNFTASI